MPEIEYYDMEKNKVGKVTLPSTIFEAKINRYVMHEVVRMQLNRKRAGTAKTKARSEVMGGGKKPYRQKGTGRARHGSIRSPIWRGGGTTFGPQPRSYDFRPPAKVRRAAIISALSLRFKENKILVMNSLDFPGGKTKEVYGFMKKFDLPSALVVDAAENEKLKRGIRNLENYKYLPPEGINTYDILKHSHLVLTLKGLEGILKRFAVSQ